jgi:NAD-dependent SIR2 family protein deacetylase
MGSSSASSFQSTRFTVPTLLPKKATSSSSPARRSLSNRRRVSPETAADRGATLAVVNLDPTPLDGTADYLFNDDEVTVLPGLVETV